MFEKLKQIFKKSEEETKETAIGPWVKVIEVHFDKDDPTRGYFELDWNDLFIKELLQAGYGSEGDEPEQIVDRWFKDIIFNMLQEEGLDTNRNAGYINVVPIDKGKSEVS